MTDRAEKNVEQLFEILNRMLNDDNLTQHEWVELIQHKATASDRKALDEFISWFDEPEEY